MSLLADLFLLVVYSLALLGGVLLWRAFRRENHALLHIVSGLIVLEFGLLLLIVYFFLFYPLRQAAWPWSWVIEGLSWFLFMLAIVPFFYVGINLVWKKSPAAPAARIDWSWLLFGPGVGCLFGMIAGFHWLGYAVSFFSISAQGSAPVLFGSFSLNGFLESFLWWTMLFLPRAFYPPIAWWVRSFSVRRWCAIGITLLLLSLIIIAWLI